MSDEKQADIEPGPMEWREPSSILAVLALLLSILPTVSLYLTRASRERPWQGWLLIFTFFAAYIAAPALALMSLKLEIRSRANVIMVTASLAVTAVLWYLFCSGRYFDMLGWS